MAFSQCCEAMAIETASKLQAMQLMLEAEGMSTLAISGLKTAVGDFNSWQGAARVYFDKSVLTVWTNVDEGPGSFDDYKSEQIVEVYQKATSDIRERDNRVTMYELRNVCENKLADK